MEKRCGESRASEQPKERFAMSQQGEAAVVLSIAVVVFVVASITYYRSRRAARARASSGQATSMSGRARIIQFVVVMLIATALILVGTLTGVH
jgi:cytochrome c biogenesis factor